MTGWNTFTSKQKTAVELTFGALSSIDEITRRSGADEAGKQAGKQKIGFSDLYSFATGSDSVMSNKLRRALTQDDRLREDLDKLLGEIALYHAERVAAASTGKVDIRHGDGFEIRLHESQAAPQQVYVIIELKDKEADPPTALFLCHSHTLCQKHKLPGAQDGIIQILANSDCEMVETLRDIDTRVFLR